MTSSELHPGETEASALRRRVKMHEFLMSGGTPLKERDANGNIQYSPPIEVGKTPICPFHGDLCDAWDEIVAGRGEWTKMQMELEGLRAMPESPRATRLIAELEAKLAERPMDFKALRERTPEEFAAEKARLRAADPRVYAAAGPKTGGNPWDKPRNPNAVPYGNGTKAPRPKREQQRIHQPVNMSDVYWDDDGIARHKSDDSYVDFGTDDGSPRPTYDRRPAATSKPKAKAVSETASDITGQTATEIEIDGEEDDE